MSIKKSSLGRNLDILLSNTLSFREKLNEKEPKILKHVPVEWLERGPYQPRTTIDPSALEELAQSIKKQGIIQPIIVRPTKTPERFEIIAGERRWRAAQLAELREVPVVIHDVPNETAMALALIENIQREDLSPLEEAQAFERLIHEFKLTHQEVALMLGKSRAAISNLLRLLGLEAEVKALLQSKQLDMGHARALLALEGEHQTQAAHLVVTRGLSVRETEKLVQKYQEAPEPLQKSQLIDPNTQKLQRELGSRLGAKVRIQHNQGKGSLVIYYNTLEELDGILAHMA